MELLGPTPKVAANDGVEDVYDDVRTVLAREKVVQIRISACKVCEALSKGLKSGFSTKANRVVPVLLAQFKEKSKPLEEQIMHSVMCFMQTSTSLGAHVSHLQAALKEKKLPQIREKALELSRRILEHEVIGASPPQDAVTLFLGAFVSAIKETTPTVRALGVSGMKVMLAKFGAEDSPFHTQVSKALNAVPVSYTHLTLPTKRIV